MDDFKEKTEADFKKKQGRNSMKNIKKEKHTTSYKNGGAWQSGKKDEFINCHVH